MVNSLITVVVPIHNSEGRTAKLRESIQNARNINFVLVFDSCDDGTVGEFDAILENCETLKVQAIYGEFGSPGFARNAGLKLVDSEWVVFWDADDFPDSGALLDCIYGLNEKNFDMIVTQYSKTDFLSQEKISRESDTRHKYQLVVDPGIWRILFNTCFVNEVRFPSFRMGEDQCFLAEILSKNPNLFFSSQITYVYTLGSPGQLTRDPRARLELKSAIRFTIRQALKTRHNRLALGLMLVRQMISFSKMRFFG